MKKIGVMGTGTMGSGIIQVCAQNGFDVVIRSSKQDYIDAAVAKIDKNLEKLVSKEKITADDKAATLGRISGGDTFDVLKDCDIIIESSTEDMEKKKELFKQLDEICKDDAILATNTSALSITELASVTTKPDRVIGMHFFNPVPAMKLVEVVKGIATSDAVKDEIIATTEALGKTPVEVAEAPGFVVNRILVPMINEAIGIYADGVASVEGIDTAMKGAQAWLRPAITGANAPKLSITLFDDDADETVVILTQAGFVKRMTPKAYDKAVAAAEFADTPRQAIRTMTDAKLLFFTDMGNCYILPAEKVAEAARAKDRGLPLGGVLAGLENDESLVALIEAGDWSGELLFATRKGLVKRTALSEYNVRKSKFAALNLKNGDRLLDVLRPEGSESLLLLTKQGMAIHFAIGEVSVIGRTAAGVKAIALGADDEVAFIFAHNSEGEVVLISDMGYMKRCLLFDFERQARGGKGVKAFNFLKNGSNGTCLAGALVVREAFNFEIVQKNGARTPCNTEDVAIEPRTGRGQPYVVVVMDDVVTELVKA